MAKESIDFNFSKRFESTKVDNSTKSASKMTKEKARQVSTLTVGILIGFVFGFSTTLFVSWSTLLVEDSDAKESHSRERQLSRPDYLNRPITKWNSEKKEIGWKNIHVFYGDNSHMFDATDMPKPYFEANKWFSQYRQDEIVSKLLRSKREGYFIDLAANDAVRLSNTYALETHFDWNGLCLEPNPIYWTGLTYRKCNVVAAIVGNKTMEEVSFRFPRNKAPKGGILGDTFDNKNDQWNEGHPRFTVSLLEVFEKFQVPKVIDYISLDIEGAEDLVMSSFPFLKYRFNIMTVERPSDVLSTILTANGYVMLKTIKKNTETLWAHRSILASLDESALDIDSQNYKYNDSKGRIRIIPEETTSMSSIIKK
jgi:hypothetical protein